LESPAKEQQARAVPLAPQVALVNADRQAQQVQPDKVWLDLVVPRAQQVRPVLEDRRVHVVMQAT